MAAGEFRLGDVLEQEAQHGVAFGARQIDDVGGEAGIDEQALLAGGRVGAHHRVDHRGMPGPRLLPLGLLGRAGEAVGREGFGEIMRRREAVEEALQPVRKAGIGGHHVRPQRVAADRRQLAGIEHRAHRRRLDEGDVGVPVVVVGRIAGMGVQHDDLLHLGIVGIERVDMQRAEAGGEVALLAWRQFLILEEQHAVAIEQRADRRHRFIAEPGRQVDAADGGADRSADRPHLEVGEKR